jgi:hypothetical protein
MPEGLLADCGGPYEPAPEHTLTCWENQPTSPAETAIMTFLAAEPERYRGKRLLHIGVGNSALPIALAADLAGYVGVTISLPEIERFKSLLGAQPGASVLFANKYDVAALETIEGDFDVIVDTLLKSMACCEKHFMDMMDFLAFRLRSGGALITTRNGVLFGWLGNTQMAHTPGAQTDPAIARFRVLGVEGLASLGAQLGMTLQAHEVPTSPGAPPSADQILILTKV